MKNQPPNDRTDLLNNNDDVEEDLLKKVGAYVDGELPSEERETVENHLSTNSTCREAAQIYRWLDDVSAREPVPEVSGEEWAQVWDEINRRKDQVGSGDSLEFGRPAAEPIVEYKASEAEVVRGRFSPMVLAAAAAVVLSVLALVLFKSTEPPPQTKENNVAEHVDGEKPEVSEDGFVRYEDF